MSLLDALIHARRYRSVIAADRLPADLLPADLSESYAVSAGVMAALGETPGGWKVGTAPDGTPVAAPMYASGFLASGATWALAPGRAIIPEIEIALRLARDLPRGATTRAELLSACDQMLIGIEIIERRIPDDAPPFALNLADDLGNVAYVTGDAITDFATLDLARLPCRFRIDGIVQSDRIGGHGSGDPMIPFLDWANHPRDDAHTLKAGSNRDPGQPDAAASSARPRPHRGGDRDDRPRCAEPSCKTR